MYIRLENCEAAHVVEAARYTVVRNKGPVRLVVWPRYDNDKTIEFVLTPENNKDWMRFYVMNANGRTIDRGQAEGCDDR